MEHLVTEALAHGGTVGRDTAVDVKAIGRDKGRPKEREALNVVPVRVTEKQVGLNGGLLQKLLPEDTQPRPTVKNEPLSGNPNFDTGGIASVPHRRWSWSRHASANAPKLNCKFCRVNHFPTLNPLNATMMNTLIGQMSIAS
jgi:hypothetical protein